MSLMHFTSTVLDHPRIGHAFFGRGGGVSEGIYAGLNCGQGSADEPTHVAENRVRVAAHFATTADRLCTLHQIHSTDVVTISEPTQASIRADAMVTAMPGLVLGILTADCAPVLFADAQAGVIGAAHAGWQGAVGGIVENAVQAMLKLGARRAQITACVGPAIAQQSYEVGADRVADITRTDPAAAAFFHPSMQRTHRQFDLPGYVLQQLRGAGLRDIRAVAMDTYANAAQFFSFRRTTHAGEADYGRQISCITLRERRGGNLTPFTGHERRTSRL